MAIFNFIVSTGVIVPDTSTTLAEVQQEYRDSFNNQDLVVDSGPVQPLVNAEVNSRDSVARNNAQMANQINPREAGGVALDAIMALTDNERIAATRTVVTATLGGVAGTTVPSGSTAITVNNQRFTLRSQVEIGAGGTVDGIFDSVDFGPVPVAPGELNQIAVFIDGWETVSNAAAAVEGRNVESDAAARRRREETLALQGLSVIRAISSNVRNVIGVRSLTIRENDAGTATTIDGVNISANSIYVCVDGGDDNEIAAALLDSKTTGAGWHSGAGTAVSVNITEPTSGQSYVVAFDRPEELDIDVEITANPLDSVIDPIQTARQAMLDYANGLIDGFGGLTVGTDVDVFDIVAGINAANGSLNVSRVRVALDGQTLGTDLISVGIFQRANASSTNITVVIT